MKADRALAKEVQDICRQAGDAIMAVYGKDDIGMQEKADKSPVTAADMAAHQVISDRLEALTPELPILSEEGRHLPLSERSKWQQYWLVDPLDGTREFVAGTDEFTVNVALIDGNETVFGVIYAPVTDIYYFGGRETEGAWRQVGNKDVTQIRTRPCAPEGLVNVAVSRRHGRNSLSDLLGRFDQRFSEVHLTMAGSSLKGCLVAEGSLDIYPRRGPTGEWDTAAAQAILEAAGGRALVAATMQPLRYNTHEGLLNPDFYMIGDPSAEWESLLV